MNVHTRYIDPARLKAIALFAASGDVRSYLNGVHFDLSSTQRTGLVATDGHSLATMPATHAAEEVFTLPEQPSCIIGLDTISTVLKVHGRAPTFLQLTVEESPGVDNEDKPITVRQVTLRSPQGAAIVGEIDGRYPEYRRVIPAYAGPCVELSAFNAEYLGKFAKACKVLGSRHMGVCLMQETANRPARVSMEDCHDFIGVIMPMNGGDAVGAPLPEWYTAVDQPQEVAIAA